MKAHLLTIGDELLIGQTTNTNAAWLGDRLSDLGVQVERAVTVGDDRSAMLDELDRSVDRADLVLMTGGLGPTHDDLTREVVAEYFDAALETNDEILARIRRYYERRQRQMPSAGPKLAQVPEGFDILDNPVGAAVGLWYETTHEGSDRLLGVLPGVPQEMKGIFDAAVTPRLEARSDLRGVTHRTLVTSGIGESSLQERLGDLSDVLDEGVHLAYLPSTSGVRLRLTANTPDRSAARAQLDAVEEHIRERAGHHVIGTGDVTLEEVLGEQFRSDGATIASAESATGGLIGHRLTNVSGASDYYFGTVVAYANAVKSGVLGVREDSLAAYGAVSEPVALEMAEGVRELLGVDVGVATTGIAGPKGGTPDKPVGTVWLGYADGHRSRAVRQQFVEDRSLNKSLFATAALDLVRRERARRAEKADS